ncbi:MAG: ATP-binding cassette domain-containing protein [Sphaerochaetaceae bacterium]
MNTLTLLPGQNRYHKEEPYSMITLKRGNLYSIVGDTGSGKTRLIKDIEQLTFGDSITRRKILLDNHPVQTHMRHQMANSMVAHLGQSMRFVLDLQIKDFLILHAQARGIGAIDCNDIIAATNRITQEPVSLTQNLSELSGGQSRALMVSDIAFLSPTPIILVDEIENAGIDKQEALKVLADNEKLVLVVTHDPHTALMAKTRIVLKGGGIIQVLNRTDEEKTLFETLDEAYHRQRKLQQIMRDGGMLA